MNKNATDYPPSNGAQEHNPLPSQQQWYIVPQLQHQLQNSHRNHELHPPVPVPASVPAPALQQQQQLQHQSHGIPLIHHQGSSVVNHPAGWHPPYHIPPTQQQPVPSQQPHFPYTQVNYSYGNHAASQDQPHFIPVTHAPEQYRQLPTTANGNAYPPPRTATISVHVPAQSHGPNEQMLHLQQHSQYSANHSSNHARNPLPPYAIATVNNNQGKRQKPNDNSGISRRGFRNSRRRHRNSHLGCATCKSRRIKCDELLPECRNCVRAKLRCAYLALDDAARDALKIAQQAHAARVESLTLQSGDKENNHQYHYPYNTEGLPTKILGNPLPPYPPSNVQPIQINLQMPFFPPQPIFHHPSQNSSGDSMQHQPQVHQHIDRHVIVQPRIKKEDTTCIDELSPSQKISPSEDRKEPDSSIIATTSISPEPRFAIDANSYATLSALIKDHKDVNRNLDDFAKSDGEYVEIVMDPKCTKHLNKSWTALDKALLKEFENGFEKESLYKEYDSYRISQMREAKNNIVLFKSLLSNGAAILAQFSHNPEVKELANKQLNRDFEISLRFLNKFRIQFTIDTENIQAFYENITLCFSKFQIYQTALPTTIYSTYTLKDNLEVTNRFFDFVISYVNAEFTVFLDPGVIEKYRNNQFFERAAVFNDYMHVFIEYYVQCIKAYHTKPYHNVFMKEFLKNFLDIKEVIYDKLSDEDKKDYDNLREFLTALVDYWTPVNEGAATNRLQVIFYTLKKFLSIIPGKSYLVNSKLSFELLLLQSYYQATVEALKAIYSEVRFFFAFSFNASDGTRSATAITNLMKRYSEPDQIKLQEYPTRVISFFKVRGGTISQLLSDVSNFPARIILDESNKQILMNLVKEVQVESFSREIPKESYPHIDQSSSFYNKRTNSIVIPSVSTTRSFSNFEISQRKRVERLKKAVEDDLTDLDRTLVRSFFEEIKD